MPNTNQTVFGKFSVGEVRVRVQGWVPWSGFSGAEGPEWIHKEEPWAGAGGASRKSWTPTSHLKTPWPGPKHPKPTALGDRSSPFAPRLEALAGWRLTPAAGCPRATGGFTFP